MACTQRKELVHNCRLAAEEGRHKQQLAAASCVVVGWSGTEDGSEGSLHLVEVVELDSHRHKERGTEKRLGCVMDGDSCGVQKEQIVEHHHQISAADSLHTKNSYMHNMNIIKQTHPHCANSL